VRGVGSGLGGASRLNHLFDGRAEPGLLVGTGVAVHHPNLHRLIDFAEGGIQAGLNRFFGGIARGLAEGGAGGEAALHQGAHGRLVGAVLQAVAFGNLDALFRGLVIGHRRFLR